MKKTKYEELCEMCKETISAKAEALRSVEEYMEATLADGFGCRKDCISLSFKEGYVEGNSIKGDFSLSVTLNTLGQSQVVTLNDLSYEYSYSDGAKKIVIYCCDTINPFIASESGTRLIDSIFKELKKKFI